MRSAWVLLILLAGCQGSYPLPPTLCDEWCDADRNFTCSPYDPAGCVETCEQQGFSTAECTPYTRTAIDCMRAHSGQHVTCNSGVISDYVCGDAVENAIVCADTTQSGSGPAP